MLCCIGVFSRPPAKFQLPAEAIWWTLTFPTAGKFRLPYETLVRIKMCAATAWTSFCDAVVNATAQCAPPLSPRTR
eukprot:6106616-Pleurochrysis_carterae.AAC.1